MLGALQGENAGRSSLGRDDHPRSERRQADAKRGELRRSDRDAGWEVFAPASAFKNSGSSFFGGRPFRLVPPSISGPYPEIEAYISRHRAGLRPSAAHPTAAALA